MQGWEIQQDKRVGRIIEEIVKDSGIGVAEGGKQGVGQKVGGSGGRGVRRKSDEDLALWQSRYPQDSPQFKLGQSEWNRRQQTRAHRFTIAGIIIGAVLTLIVQLALRYFIR